MLAWGSSRDFKSRQDLRRLVKPMSVIPWTMSSTGHDIHGLGHPLSMGCWRQLVAPRAYDRSQCKAALWLVRASRGQQSSCTATRVLCSAYSPLSVHVYRSAPVTEMSFIFCAWTGDHCSAWMAAVHCTLSAQKKDTCCVLHEGEIHMPTPSLSHKHSESFENKLLY